VPALIAVTSPLFVIAATALFDEVHIPCVDGVILVVSPIHRLLAPELNTNGLSFTVSMPELFDVHPVTASINLNVANPGLTAVITPALLITATLGLLLAQVPVVPELIVEVWPIHNDVAPTKLIDGLPFTIKPGEGSDIHPDAEVNVNVAIP
jgi:hypothetical protein